jgi:hypothetical protein
MLGSGWRFDCVVWTSATTASYGHGFYRLNILIFNDVPFINHPSIFGSIVVSISACHSKEQLAGGRGSIPRQRDTFVLRLFAFRPVWQRPHDAFFAVRRRLDRKLGCGVQHFMHVCRSARPSSRERCVQGVSIHCRL